MIIKKNIILLKIIYVGLISGGLLSVIYLQCCGGGVDEEKNNRVRCIDYYRLNENDIEKIFNILNNVLKINAKVLNVNTPNIVEADTNKGVINYDLYRINTIIEELCNYNDYFNNFANSINWILFGWYAHELGHIYFNKLRRRFSYSKDEEDEADIFAGNLLKKIHADSTQAKAFIIYTYNINNILPGYVGVFDKYSSKYSIPNKRLSNYIIGWRSKE